MHYRIETGTLGIYDVDGSAEAARVLRWIRSRFRVENPDPMGYLILKRENQVIFTASHDVPSIYLPEDTDRMIEKGVEAIGWRYAQLQLLANYHIRSQALNQDPSLFTRDYAEDAGLVCWADSTHPGYMAVDTPIRFEAYMGRYGVGIRQHYRYDNSSRFHGCRYWIRPEWTIQNPYLPAPETDETEEA